MCFRITEGEASDDTLEPATQCTCQCTCSDSDTDDDTHTIASTTSLNIHNLSYTSNNDFKPGILSSSSVNSSRRNSYAPLDNNNTDLNIRDRNSYVDANRDSYTTNADLNNRDSYRIDLCKLATMNQHTDWHKMWNPRASMSFNSAKGLLNEPGQNNCFLNSAVQVGRLSFVCDIYYSVQKCNTK